MAFSFGGRLVRRPRVNLATMMVVVLLMAVVSAALRIAASKHAAIADLLVRLELIEADAAGKQEVLATVIRDGRPDPPAGALDSPDGRVTAVNYEGRVVQVDITRAQGAAVGLKMSIYDSSSPGISRAKHMCIIKLTQVCEHSSTAKIIMANSSVASISKGDIAYSPVWSPNAAMRFALLGRIDLDGDDKDDREELKRMIGEVGGVIEFDLQSPESAKESGTLSPRIDWYVVGDHVLSRNPDSSFDKRMREAIKEARLNGIRPMPLRRLLAYLEYSASMPIADRTKNASGNRTQPAAAARKTSEISAKSAAPKR
jgi:hypothetical protein